jgi:SIR2-like domain
LSRELDPSSHANYLRQCLSHDKRPLGLLLGAGCPMAVRVRRAGGDEPLIPDIAGITKLVATKFVSSPAKPFYDLVHSHFKTDGLPPPNVEQLLSHVRSLRQVSGKESVRGLTSKELDEVDSEICKILGEACTVNLPDTITPYHLLASWAGAISRVTPVEIFTTNYDLLAEEALESNRVPYFDGFVGSNETFFDLQAIEDDQLPPRWARLWKIHGSLNWHEDKRGAIRRSGDREKRRVIYPSHLKYDESRRMPYLAMIDRMRAFLRNDSAVLVTVGFSFKDVHLNEIVVQGLQGNPTSVVFALLHGKLEHYDELARIAETRSNLTVMARDGGVIGTRRCAWPTGKDAKGCNDSISVEWLDDAAKPGLKDAQFVLGDFATLGRFLEDLIGKQDRSANP